MYIPEASVGKPDSTINDIFIDTEGHQVKVGRTEITLTLKEFDMLLFFMKKRGKLVTRPELIQEVWGLNELETGRTIDIHVCRLRKKIEPNPHHPKHLVSIRGCGYKLKR